MEDELTLFDNRWGVEPIALPDATRTQIARCVARVVATERTDETTRVLLEEMLIYGLTADWPETVYKENDLIVQDVHPTRTLDQLLTNVMSMYLQDCEIKRLRRLIDDTRLDIHRARNEEEPEQTKAILDYVIMSINTEMGW